MNDETKRRQKRPPLPPNSKFLHSINSRPIAQIAPLRNYSNGIRIKSFNEQLNEKIDDDSKVRSNKPIHYIKPYFLAFLLDPIIPILLIVSSISCTSVMGMIFILILTIHILICNNLKDSFSLLKICLLINLLFHIVVLVFSIYVLAAPNSKIFRSKAIKILGLNFDNEIISTPILPLVSSIIAILCQLLSLILTPFTLFTEFRYLRSRVFKSTTFLFLIDFLWEICNVFNASSNLSFFSLPLILYLSLSVISISLSGANYIPKYIIKVMMVYSIIYSLFEAYMLSYLGDLYNFKSTIRYNYIGPLNSKAANYVFAVIFSYMSVQNLSAPGHKLSVSKRVPTLIIIISNVFLLIEFFLCFLFALFYPNYLSILWMIISICASFVGIKTVKKFFFPLLVITYTFSFVPIILTTFGIFRRPIDYGMDYYNEFLELFGLFRYINDFTFSICGFFIMCFFGIIGRITLAKVKKKKIPLLSQDESQSNEKSKKKSKKKDKDKKKNKNKNKNKNKVKDKDVDVDVDNEIKNNKAKILNQTKENKNNESNRSLHKIPPSILIKPNLDNNSQASDENPDEQAQSTDVLFKALVSDEDDLPENLEEGEKRKNKEIKKEPNNEGVIEVDTETETEQGEDEDSEEEKEAIHKKTKLQKFVIGFIWMLKYFCVFVILVVGVTGSYYKDRLAFVIFGSILLFFILLGLYNRSVFYIIKIMSCLFFVITSYFKITINQECQEHEECLGFGHFGSYSKMLDSGIVAPLNMTLPKFLWPMIIVFIFCTFLFMLDSLYYKLKYKKKTNENDINFNEKGRFKKKIKKKKSDLLLRAVPGRFYNYAHFLIGLLHLIHLFAYTTNIFSILFLLVGISVLTCMYFQKDVWMKVVACFSSIFMSVYLVLYYLSHFEKPRNLITSLFAPDFINISQVQTPKFEIVLLTVILILTTMFTQTSSDDHFELIQDFFYEIRTIFYYFEFYLCWLCIFIFSIVNNNPSFIKFILMVFFGFGQISIANFRKIRIFFLLFNIIYLCVQLGCVVFDVDNPSHRYYEVLKYIGFFFSREEVPTKHERNISMIWQLACIFVCIVGSKKYEKREKKEEFEKLLSTKLYRGIVALLHYFLPVIVLGSLCISTCYNRSIFGWFTFIIMVLLTYKRNILYKRSKLITFLFNLLFVVYYLLYLGFPDAIFHKSINVFSHVSNRELTENWLVYLGVYDIQVSSLIANCISAYVFSVFLKFHNIKVDYDYAFNNLPFFLRSVIKVFVSYIYEVMMIVLSIIATNIHTLDGFFYFFITSLLFYLSLLFHYDKSRALLILAHATFLIIAYHLLSRMPIFTDIGMGSYIKKLFNLPFQGTAKYRNFWTAIYCCERVCLHILLSDLYHNCYRAKTINHAYRFIRSRKLKIIEKLDQHILKNKDELINQKIKNINKDNYDEIMHDLSSSFEILTRDGLERASTAYFKFLDSTERSHFELSEDTTSSSSSNIKISNNNNNNNNNDDNDNSNHDNDDEEEDEDEYDKKISKKQKTKRNFVHFWDSLGHWFANKFIIICVMTFNPNCEAGLNVYTLQSIIDVMKRQLESYDVHKKAIISQRDYKFIKKLPPSFLYQYQSLADAIDFQIYTSQDVYSLLGRYFFMFIRRISFFLLFIMIIVYVLSRPYLMGFIILLLFIFFICSFYIPNSPNRYQVFMFFVILILSLRSISKLDILASYIVEQTETVKVERMKISPYKLFGIDSSVSFIPEILLYVFTIFYIIDQRAWCEFFTPNYYFKKFRNEIEGFPNSFKSGNPYETNIVNSLGMEIGKQPLVRCLKKHLESRSLIEPQHAVYMNIIDTISLLILILFWSTWTHDNAGSLIESATMSYSFQIDVLFIFVLIIHVVFMLFFDYCHIAKVLFPMIFVNIIWLTYTYCMSFFYIPCVNRNFNKGSLYFFVFLRILSSILACHRIQKGKVVVEYQLLSFEKDWKSIILKNKFILFCPFIFEVQSLLMWMSRKTYVDFIDFLMIRDFGMNLEILISSHFDPKSKGPPQKQKVYLIGSVLLLLFFILLFGPLFFMTSGSGATSTNSPVSATLKVGMTPFRPFYESMATIQTVTKQQMQELSNNRSPYLNVLIMNSNEDSSILHFQNNPPNYWFPNENEIDNVVSIIEKGSNYVELCPYYELSFVFQSPTTNSNSQFISKYFKGDCLESVEDRNKLISILKREETGTVLSFEKMPLLYLIPTSDLTMDDEDLTRTVNFDLMNYDSDHIEMNPVNESEKATFSFFHTDYLTILIFSQPVSSDNIIGSFIQDKGGITGIYILIIVTFGVVIRNTATSQLDDLWLDRMGKPQKLYRIIVTINTFRAANDCENELKTTETLLNLLRSKETCMKITDDVEDENRN